MIREIFGLTETDRKTLAVLGALLLAGLFLIWRLSQHSAWVAAGSPVLVAQSAGWDRQLETARKVDINTADVAELERLPGIGPALALRIVSYRETHGAFGGVEALLKVEGIGPKTLEALKDYLAIGR